ncbi:polysaccharide biosynthesis/export family protein, partial [Acinetobacter baumannii]
NITLPKLGKIKAAGLTKTELSKKLEMLMVDEIKNPYVLVRLNQFKVNVLGEVKKPGVVIIKGTETVNIIDVLSESGDLTEYGKKNNIAILR